MNIVKKLFVQSMAISVSLLLINGIHMVVKHFSGQDIVMLWYHPISILLTGVLCALPTLLLRNMEEWPPRVFLRRVALHGLLLYAIVAGAGRLLGWYEDTAGLVCVSVIFLTVYIFVWLISHWMDRQDVKKINSALDSIRDSE